MKFSLAKNLNDNFNKLDLDFEVGKKVNDALVKQLASLEHRYEGSV